MGRCMVQQSGRLGVPLFQKGNLHLSSLCLQAAEVRKCLRKGQEVAGLELLIGGNKEGIGLL